MKFWIVKGNPELNDLNEMLVPGESCNWYDPKNQVRNGAKAGDGIFFWSSRRDRFLIGLGKMGNPFTAIDEHNLYRFDVTYLTKPFSNKVTIDELKKDPLFNPKNPNRPYFIIPGPVQTRYPLTTEQAERLAEMISEKNANVTLIRKIFSAWFPKLGKTNLSKQKSPKALDLESCEFPEGEKIYKLHLSYERNNVAVRKAKKLHQAKHKGKLPCTICKFDFSEKYNEVGKDFAEVHHAVPISWYKKRQNTLLSDLVVVCSNCHRMLHRRRPCLTVQSLEKLLTKKGR